ncbi:hypothetical protein [Duganella violaceipulchra]|uniref:Uncharacterized protein YjbJ (UPF0337 family) n=1 Tax=Duganella violaceipulchra TaxID=2849652 RepID=A0AA41H891_9BURK|nr:hypothetical protein [Duganella violaceicalia]MBV6322455.1 hypothetical protein [Duganella violaceicalia]MCP2010660.1 uncharacterized protein YjbJ (UPF0337 family) [Duganella violaceicalia]
MAQIQNRVGDATADDVTAASGAADQSSLNTQYDNSKTLQQQLQQQAQNMKINFHLQQATAVKSMADKVQL